MSTPTLEQRARTERLALVLDHLANSHGIDRNSIDYNNAEIGIYNLKTEHCGKECNA